MELDPVAPPMTEAEAHCLNVALYLCNLASMALLNGRPESASRLWQAAAGFATTESGRKVLEQHAAWYAPEKKTRH